MKGNRKRWIFSYFSALFRAAKQGDAREESFYPTLRSLLEPAALVHGKTGVQVTMLPKPTEAYSYSYRTPILIQFGHLF